MPTAILNPMSTMEIKCEENELTEFSAAMPISIAIFICVPLNENHNNKPVVFKLSNTKWIPVVPV